MFRLSSSIVLDLRSVAAFRILLGCIILFDLFKRLPYAELFLSDSGALSRADLLELTDRPWSFSIYYMFGETSQVVAVMLVNAVVALSLMLGFRTRLASALCWGLLLSLQHRNPLVLNGGDTLLCLLAFWAMFLPLNARWSLDALLREKSSGSFPRSNRYLGIPGAAVVLQVVFLYGFTVVLKSGDSWKSGDAVSYVVMNQSLIKEGAVWLSQFEEILPLLSRLTWHWEWIGCVLLLSPIANGVTRMIAIFGYSVMQVSFHLTLDLALFPFVSTVACWALLPQCFWDAAERVFGKWPWARWAASMRKEADRLGLRGGSVARPGKLAAILSGCALILVFFWNVRGLPESPLKERTPEWVKRVVYVAKLRQSWSMFAANPPRISTWYALEAQLANGDSIDLLHPSEPFSLRRPELFTDRLPDRRWTKFLSNLKKKKYRRLRNDFLDYFARRWNERVGGNQKVERIRLLYFHEKIVLGSGYEKAEALTLETVWATGVRQIADTALQAGAVDEVDGNGGGDMDSEDSDL